MKTKSLLLAALSFSAVTFAQKKEIKSAEKTVESGSYAEAQTEINGLEGMMGQMDEKEKEYYYFVKGRAYLGGEENKNADDLLKAMEAFSKVSEFNDGDKYGDEAMNYKQTAMNAVISSAVDDQNAQKYDAAANKLYTLYTLTPKDTSYLYFAASNAVNGQNYDTALDYYSKLKDLGYTGIETKYTAKNKENGQVESFPSEQQRDLFVKSGSHEDPKTEVTESRSGEIAKNIALIYIQEGKNEEALGAIKDALAENPDDDALLRSAADVYLKMGMTEEYEATLNKVIAKDPNNPGLYFNLGVGAADSGNTEKALGYYRKALEIDPNYAGANLNIAALMLGKDKEIIEQMNSLGNTKADNKKYEELKAERLKLYNDAVPYLEKATSGDKPNIEAVRTLYNIHVQLGNDEEAKEYKTKLDAMQG
ncbi:tetratricopeptide repeat protein [Leeuwenhoekiella aestuarii]|uniref:Tetratricopeptide repeat protein n=1 Tax=Leeuwenhoekiella aestuarii TaxID=2249426 RepID=A0A4Q0NY57_9FLAO|nr:tetratricopeptide repeat protein [Leeuwenhoekiella aestuarii]RXG16185.1 tetratricopeptide repeat protein [Leeuwenhoekiella aestuarii]RXG16878.1 tetratricopeptide repeat protein [Leeuwenhoekiella aestuarii]